jgi:hydrogenase maturation protein HypF
MKTPVTGKRILISGIVQGVGFRPFVYTQAVKNQLKGWVRNTSAGVEIEVDGPLESIEQFIQSFKTDLPPLARIDSFSVEACQPDSFTNFEIIASQVQPGDFIPVSPDMTICPDCQRELFTPTDRRYRYPFINCTNCGPRFTIIKDIPYDRPMTTMAGFPLCPECQQEYHNPLDRRFHAQPVACPVCGPQVTFIADNYMESTGEDAIQTARRSLKEGKILAVKGLGGYHLACDAFNPIAVDELRRRKKRSDKPFALMAFDLSTIQKYCWVSEEEKKLLLSPQRPIVLLEQKPDSTISKEVAPQQHTIGVMIAYTPLHLLLLEPAPGFPDLLVMTSGNLSEEPIAYRDEDARQRLFSLADAYLTHNRPIHMRVDDSVSRIIQGKPYLSRRARGYAPDPILLPVSMPPILAVGAELKNTFCLTRDHYAFVSHYIGDLENHETLISFEQGIEHYQHLFKITPQIIACDMHPDYLATQYAQNLVKTHSELKLVSIQHHHAHLAACAADNNLAPHEPVIGLIFDGTGMGTDGHIWGGEVLVGNALGYQRFYHLKYAPLPGGSLAIHKPARMMLSYLFSTGLDWELSLPPVSYLCASERTALHSQIKLGINSPLTSSMGRLFDAVSSLLGIRHKINYEGQAAIEMEALIDADEKGYTEFNVEKDLIDPTPVFSSLISGLASGVSPARLSAHFHNSVIHLCMTLCQSLRSQTAINTVVLSGGVFQNKYLLENTIRELEKQNFIVLHHHRLPTNDGGISFGQAVIASQVS